jgi:hypothetical protein
VRLDCLLENVTTPFKLHNTPYVEGENNLEAENREITLAFALRENTKCLNNLQGISTEYLLNKFASFSIAPTFSVWD